MSREVCFLIARSGVILWADSGSGPFALPDSRARWEAIWSHRARLDRVVHSHPLGPRGFSHEDVTTMEALDAALGRPLRYAVLAPDGLYVRERGRDFASDEQPWWALVLRLTSGMKNATG